MGRFLTNQRLEGQGGSFGRLGHQQAYIAMVLLPYLQSFIDGNKRVSRLVAAAEEMPSGTSFLNALHKNDIPCADK